MWIAIKPMLGIVRHRLALKPLKVSMPNKFWLISCSVLNSKKPTVVVTGGFTTSAVFNPPCTPWKRGEHWRGWLASWLLGWHMDWIEAQILLYIRMCSAYLLPQNYALMKFWLSQALILGHVAALACTKLHSGSSSQRMKRHESFIIWWNP
jgi:hypothetical protein